MKYISKKRILGLIIVTTIVCAKIITQNTYAHSYKIENSQLFYEENNEKLAEKIKLYLTDIDDILIINSSFNYSDTLIYNYDFLVNYSLEYILKYQEHYNDQIKTIDNFQYITKQGSQKETNKYISIDEIYNITEKYFGIKDFKIINNNVSIIDNYISLTDYEEEYFPLNIEKITVNQKLPYIEATVYYENNTNYLYTFEVINNVLKIKNIEVLS